jgi:hypothetical protein
MLAKLTRDAAGKYHGAYGGQEFTVEGGPRRLPQPGWLGRRMSGVGVWVNTERTLKQATRADAVRSICNEIDMAAVQIPELDRLLERWTAEVKAVVDRLDDRPQDVRPHAALFNLRRDLSWLDGSVRMKAVQFEKDLAKLEAHVAETGALEPPLISEVARPAADRPEAIDG